MTFFKGKLTRGAWGWLLFVAGLTSCAAPAPYQRAALLAECRAVRVDGNTVDVSFAGRPDMPPETIERLLLYRCAEVTRANSADYFVIIARFLEERTTGGPGDHPPATAIFPGRISTVYEAHALIKMFKGKKPQDNRLAFDAQDVIKQLGPLLGSAS